MTTNADAIEAAGALAEALRKNKYAADQVGDTCRLSLGWLEVRVTIALRQKAAAGELVTVTYAARNPNGPWGAFEATCAGNKPTAGEADLHAAERWMALVFPVLHDMFSGHASTLGAQTAVLDPLPALGNIAWRMHVGPMLHLQYGQAPAIPPPNMGEFLGIVVGNLASTFPRENAFCVDLYLAKTDEGEVTTDCRVDNVPWTSPHEGLAAMARSWRGGAGDSWVIIRRQFIVFEPAPEGRSQVA